MTKKVLVLGATGLLGSEILYQLSKVAEVDLTASVRDSSSLSTYYQSSSSEILQFDALNFIDSPNVYEIEKYDVVINAIGAIKQIKFKLLKVRNFPGLNNFQKLSQD